MTQIILVTILEPLITELYFKNFAKYKQKYVDRIVIIPNAYHYDSYNVFVENHKKTKSENVQLVHSNLMRILEKYNIKNYIICDDDMWGMSWGARMKSNVNYITDENYDITFIDEHDAFWMNDNFNQFIDDVRFKYNMIGGARMYMSNMIYDLKLIDNINKFNKTYKTNHECICYHHIPIFVKTNILKDLDLFFDVVHNFRDDGYMNTDSAGVFLDPFQYIGFQIYKKNGKVKSISSEIWDANDNMYRNETDCNHKNIENLDKMCVFHVSATSQMVHSTLFLKKTEEQLINNYNNYQEYALNRYVAHAFLYQSLKYIDFEYKNEYLHNFEILNKHYNLNNFNYTNIFKKII